jgi:hypothetical protein
MGMLRERASGTTCTGAPRNRAASRIDIRRYRSTLSSEPSSSRRKDHFVGRPLLVELRIEFAQRSVDCVPYAPKFAIQRTPPILEIGEDPIGLPPCLVQRTAQPSDDGARSLMAKSGLAFPLREEMLSVTALVEGGRDALRYPDPLGDVRLSLEPD